MWSGTSDVRFINFVQSRGPDPRQLLRSRGSNNPSKLLTRTTSQLVKSLSLVKSKSASPISNWGSDKLRISIILYIMFCKQIIFSSFILLLLTGICSSCQVPRASTPQKVEKLSGTGCPGTNKNFSLDFLKTNNQGNQDEGGINHVIIFNPKSERLEFKVNVGLAHELYAKDDRDKVRREYVPKTFSEIISDENSTLKGDKPIAAINADYIGIDNKPQGLNMSRGIEYSGDFLNKRSSFGISGGKLSQRQATLQTGKRKLENLNFNLVGGNGRFYKNGVFKDICQDLGQFACKQATNRSMVAVTSSGYVILLVNDSKANSDIRISENNQELLPDKFDDVLKGIARNNCLGSIQEAMLFDGGMSPGFYYRNKIYVQNPGPIGSVFLIYQK